MSNPLNILLRKEEFNGMSLKEIHDELTDYTLFQWFEGSFDYFSLWHSNNKSYFGADDTNSIKSFVHDWRCEVVKEANKAEQAVRCEMERYGCKYMTDLFALNARNSTLLLDLYMNLATLTNHFSCGNDRLYYGEDYGWCTFLPEAVEREVEENPEKFILIECFYH